MSNAGWGCCKPDADNDDTFIECKKCTKTYHCACIFPDDSQLTDEVLEQWCCPQCICSAPKGKKSDSTPVRNVSTSRGNKRQALNSPPVDKQNDSLTRGDIKDILEVMKRSMDENFAEMRRSMINVFNEELKPIKHELSQLNESMSFMSNQYEDMKKANEASQLKIAELEKENVELRSTVQDLNQRINQVEQQSRQSNIELQCVPEHKNENLTKIVCELGKTVNCAINSSDIMICTRTAKLNNSSTRPRSIIVQLASPRLRDQLLADVIKYNKTNSKSKLNSSHLGLAGGSSPIYVTEHLSPSNKALHGAARLRAREKGYKFVWIRNGKIFLRKCEDADYVIVRNMDTLKNLP